MYYLLKLVEKLQVQNHLKAIDFVGLRFVLLLEANSTVFVLIKFRNSVSTFQLRSCRRFGMLTFLTVPLYATLA